MVETHVSRRPCAVCLPRELTPMEENHGAEGRKEAKRRRERRKAQLKELILLLRLLRPVLRSQRHRVSAERHPRAHRTESSARRRGTSRLTPQSPNWRRLLLLLLRSKQFRTFPDHCKVGFNILVQRSAIGHHPIPSFIGQPVRNGPLRLADFECDRRTKETLSECSVFGALASARASLPTHPLPLMLDSC
eukprot:scaffold58_cov256-Pinguiococcus_pyrenoidosus.AAC.14